MLIDFIKMHGCGNDFVVIDQRPYTIELNFKQITQLADYKKSVGFDQLLLIENSKSADISMKIFNRDGSEASACGNGSRCVAKLILEKSLKNNITIATNNRILAAKWKGELVAVDMGNAEIAEENMKFGELNGSLVEIGNPHIIIENSSELDISKYGPLIENDLRFPNKVNVNFVDVVNRDLVNLRTWERGVGATLACGSGACASFAFLYSKGLINKQAVIHQAGGNLQISIENGHVLMAGEAKVSYRGSVEI